MNCNDVQWQLVAYLDGELPDAIAAEIRAHLAECTICAQERASYETQRVMMDEWTVAPGTVWNTLRRKITPVPTPTLQQQKPAKSPTILLPYSSDDNRRLV